MKVRNYEKKELVSFFIIVLLASELLLSIMLYTIKVNDYYKIQSIVVKDDLVLLVVSKEERKIIYSNKTLFYDNHKHKYKIVEDRGIVIKRNNKNYYQLLLKFNFSKKITNDTLDLVFIKKRMHLIEIFKIIWEGD